MPRDRSLLRSQPAADRSRYSQPTWRRPGTARQPRCSTPSCALEYRRLRRFAPVADLAAAGCASVVKLRWFVERTCGDPGQERRQARGRNTPRYTHWPTLSRLRIPAHWLVLRNTVEEISVGTSDQRGFRLLSTWRSFCEALALMLYMRQFPPSESAPEAGLRIESGPVLRITPSERDALRLLAHGAPTSQ